MSDRERAGKRDIDYSIFHKTGKKVDKNRNKMDEVRREKRVKELQLRDDIDEAFTLYALADLETEDEISEGIAQISELGREYRHIHVELKEILGDNAYGTEYPVNPVTDSVRNYLTEARDKKRLISMERQGQEDKLKAQEADDKARKEEEERESVKALFMIEEQAFHQKLESEIASITLDDIEDIKVHSARFQPLLDEYFELLPKAKHIFGVRFDDEFKDVFDETVTKIRDQISAGKTKIRELLSDIEKKRDLEESAKIQQAEKAMKAEHLFNVSALSDELKMRCDALVKRCDSDLLKSADDHQILELNKKFRAN